MKLLTYCSRNKNEQLAEHYNKLHKYYVDQIDHLHRYYDDCKKQFIEEYNNKTPPGRVKISIEGNNAQARELSFAASKILTLGKDSTDSIYDNVCYKYNSITEFVINSLNSIICDEKPLDTRLVKVYREDTKGSVKFAYYLASLENETKTLAQVKGELSKIPRPISVDKAAKVICLWLELMHSKSIAWEKLDPEALQMIKLPIDEKTAANIYSILIDENKRGDLSKEFDLKSCHFESFRSIIEKSAENFMKLLHSTNNDQQLVEFITSRLSSSFNDNNHEQSTIVDNNYSYEELSLSGNSLGFDSLSNNL